MLGFYSDGCTCWNCKHFDCEFVSHRGKMVNNQWDYHRKYTCKEKGVSFCHSKHIIKDGSCELFHRGPNEARFNYGCVEPVNDSGNLFRACNSFDEIDNDSAFEYTPLYGYGSDNEIDEGECDDVFK
jgi:hypothetical protein